MVKERFLRKGYGMRGSEEQLGTSDLGLLIFVIVGGWALLFLSGLVS